MPKFLNARAAHSHSLTHSQKRQTGPRYVHTFGRIKENLMGLCGAGMGMEEEKGKEKEAFAYFEMSR